MNLQESIHRLEVVHRLEVLLEAARHGTADLVFDRRNRQHVCVMALNCTVQELATGCLILFKPNNGSCIPILLRTLLEAYVDIKNLLKNPNYVKNMDRSWLASNFNLVKAVKEKGMDNPYFTQAAQNPELGNIVAEKGRAQEEMKSAGYALLTVEKRFELAGEADRYRGVYSHLCSHAHNNLNALEERHLVVTPDGAQLTCFRSLFDEETLKYLGEMGQLVASSVELAGQAVGRQPSQLEDLSRALASFRALWTAE